MGLKKASFALVKKRIGITALIVVALVIGGYIMYANFTYSKGYRNGTVIKVSKKGVMFKTWEGQLNLGAYQPGERGKAPTTIWNFSVPKSNDGVLDEINDAITRRKSVNLHYKQKLVTLPWRGDTEYMVYKIDILE